MKIIMLVDRWSNGGVPTVMSDLSVELKSLGHDISWIFYYSGNPEIKSFQQIELNARYSGDPKALLALKSHLKLLNPDVIHDHFGGIWASAYLFSKWSKKAILHYHNEFNVVSDSPDDRRVLKESLFKNILMKRYKKIVAVSEHNAVTIKTFLKNENNVTVISNSVSKPKHISNKRKNDTLTIGYLGRLVYEKGIDSLLEAIALLPKSIVVNVLIAGDGDQLYIEALAQIIKKHKLNTIQFLGRIEDKDEFFSKIDCMYFGSRQEPFGLTILESWSYQTPIVGFYPENGGGPYEIFKEGTKSGGHLLTSRSSTALSLLIKDIVENREWISKKKEGMDKKLSPYYIETILPKWIELYKSVQK